ncbi:hypothetical protein SLEP1_g15378 [Rubroshorea leprosula]|uniref:Uncharacterized protein n=1 Tax=Rubroshorea leprosula TaxID=152421 RepID=A0AAV5IXN5_9ROSI|nr:hypothetical protein SLEP1_g15378 [Rubroshorea leprosula]
MKKEKKVVKAITLLIGLVIYQINKPLLARNGAILTRVYNRLALPTKHQFQGVEQFSAAHHHLFPTFYGSCKNLNPVQTLVQRLALLGNIERFSSLILKNL